MIRKMREEELIVYIYLKSSDKYRKYLNLTSYSYTQKKEQSPDILTQQISVDSDCANDDCVALSERFSASLQKQLSIGERKNFEKRKPVAGTDPVSALLIAPQ